jgi:putative hydrolase of the HAD superfamily
VLAEGGFSAREGAMFDDIARNLVAAHGLGMTTVWLNTESDWERQGPEFPVASALHIDHETRDLTLFLNSIRI